MFIPASFNVVNTFSLCVASNTSPLASPLATLRPAICNGFKVSSAYPTDIVSETFWGIGKKMTFELVINFLPSSLPSPIFSIVSDLSDNLPSKSVNDFPPFLVKSKISLFDS